MAPLFVGRLWTRRLPVLDAPRLLRPAREARLLVERLGWGTVPVEVLGCLVPEQPRFGLTRSRAPLVVHGEALGEVLLTVAKLEPRLYAVFNGVALEPIGLRSESLAAIQGGVAIIVRDALERDAALAKPVKDERYQLIVAKATALAKRLDATSKTGPQGEVGLDLALRRREHLDEFVGAKTVVAYALVGVYGLGCLFVWLVELFTAGVLGLGVFGLIYAALSSLLLLAIRRDLLMRRRKALFGPELRPVNSGLRMLGPGRDERL